VDDRNGRLRFRVTPPLGNRETIFFTMQHLKRWLPTVVISGISSVGRAVIQKKKDSQDELEMWVEGSDLQRVMGTPGVLADKTECNHVMAIEKYLGIEAARTKIAREIDGVMRGYSISIDARHLMLVADVMTFRGTVLGITRHGISKMKESVLMLASFERMTDFLFDAGAHSRIDHIRGVSESIICGMPINLGTGLFKVLHRVDAAQLHELKSVPTLLSKISKPIAITTQPIPMDIDKTT
jgi:DNA-directed RNA polymerase III subunit RPC1